MPLPLHYVRRLTVVSLLVYTNTYGSDMYYNNFRALNTGGPNQKPGRTELVILMKYL